MRGEFVCPSCGKRHDVQFNFFVLPEEKVRSKVLNMLRILASGKKNFPVSVDFLIERCTEKRMKKVAVIGEIRSLEKFGHLYFFNDKEVALT